MVNGGGDLVLRTSFCQPRNAQCRGIDRQFGVYIAIGELLWRGQALTMAAFRVDSGER